MIAEILIARGCCLFNVTMGEMIMHPIVLTTASGNHTTKHITEGRKESIIYLLRRKANDSELKTRRKRCSVSSNMQMR